MTVALGDYVYGSFSETSDKGTLLLTTEVLDFGLAGFKSIESVALSFSATTAVTSALAEVLIYWRNDRKSSFRATSWFRTDPLGMAFPMVTALEFKVSVRLTDLSAGYLDSLTTFFKAGDGRFGRSDFRLIVGEQGESD
jgi:hypothetical protein